MQCEGLPVADCTSHGVEPVEELHKLAGNFLAVALGDRFDAPLADPFHVARQDTEGLDRQEDVRVRSRVVLTLILVNGGLAFAFSPDPFAICHHERVVPFKAPFVAPGSEPAVNRLPRRQVVR